MIKNPLLDTLFLHDLYNQINNEKYVKIISLNFNEEPLEEIQGKILAEGSSNIDGSSAVRRSCSFTMLADNNSILTDYYWTVSSKFKYEIGLKNNINPEYPDIIWFPQGLYIINSFSATRDLAQIKISISGKDKMCLLNGEVSGTFPFSIDLAKEIEYSEDALTIQVGERRLLLKELILYLVHIFGKEALHNIVINDLDEELSVELLQYNGDEPIYYLRDESGVVQSIVINKNESVYPIDTNSATAISEIERYFSLSPLMDNSGATQVTKIKDGTEKYTVIKIMPRQTAGYRETDLVYPQETFEVKSGSSITSALDSIIKHFVDYEYFYDIYGRFIFQKKKTYINSSWSPLDSQQLKVDVYSNTEEAWTFNNSELVSSISNTPNLLNLKNDYTVWGERQGIDGKKIPIHARYAIDTKPTFYLTTGLGAEPPTLYSVDEWDWRELIFQMAKDYYDNNQKQSEFFHTLSNNNPWVKNYKTGYEQYYVDILGYWRSLYDENGWKIDVLENPETIDFWLDFIEGNQTFSRYDVSQIGDRTKVVNDSKATSNFFRETVDVLFVKQIPEIKKDGYTYIQLPSQYENLFIINKSQKSTKDELDNLLYNYSYCAETITLNTIPIYHLEPNVKIFINDPQNSLYGHYILNKISISFTQNGMMSLTLLKDVERIY